MNRQEILDTLFKMNKFIVLKSDYEDRYIFYYDVIRGHIWKLDNTVNTRPMFLKPTHAEYYHIAQLNNIRITAIGMQSNSFYY
jgi:elongation factor P hydroxylase